jgi:hypothetical protein
MFESLDPLMHEDTDMSYNIELDLPGGFDFEDVTDIFTAAAAAMAPDELILTDGFELQDAMVAFEVCIRACIRGFLHLTKFLMSTINHADRRATHGQRGDARR